MSDDEVINVTLSIRRRPGHDTIPDMDSYLFCPRRARLPHDDFAQKYGASTDDVAVITSHFQSFGLQIDAHMARRHVYLTGTAAQFNAAFKIQLRHYGVHRRGTTHRFRGHETPEWLPDHVKPTVLKVMKLNTEPFLVPHDTNGTDLPTINANLPVSFYNTIYGSPTGTSAASQTVAIGAFAGWGTWSTADVNATCANYGITSPTVVNTIVMDNINLGNGPGELLLDISAVRLFGGGAKIAIYEASTVDELISRVTFPNPGDPVCSILSISGGGNETTEADDLTAYQDAAMNGITIFASSGDSGCCDGRNNVSVSYPAVIPYVTGVGGTSVGAETGTLSTTNYVEWIWCEIEQQTGPFGSGGGGVSINYHQPTYQSKTVTAYIPATLNPLQGSLPQGEVGRGVPDISAAAKDTCTPKIYSGGTLKAIGGTSYSCPIMAGIFARVNAALGYNVGFINPTLYHGRGAFMRAITNANGTPPLAGNSVLLNPAYPLPPAGTRTSGVLIIGYPYNTTPAGWNACTGLGMINANLFVSYIQAHSVRYWFYVVGKNSAGNSTQSQVSGPWTVINP